MMIFTDIEPSQEFFLFVEIMLMVILVVVPIFTAYLYFKPEDALVYKVAKRRTKLFVQDILGAINLHENYLRILESSGENSNGFEKSKAFRQYLLCKAMSFQLGSTKSLSETEIENLHNAKIVQVLYEGFCDYNSSNLESCIGVKRELEAILERLESEH